MRVSIRTTVATYALLSLAGAVAFIMPDSITPPTINSAPSTLPTSVELLPEGPDVVRCDPLDDESIADAPAA